jgi:glycosyltransferase involved in cell wall biosynthesis
MRIVFVVHTFFPNWRAGTEVYTRSLARKVVENGHEARIVCYEPPAPQDAFEGIRGCETVYEGLPVYRISFHKRHPWFHLVDYYDPGIEEHLFRYFSAAKPDLVHVVHAMHLTTASIWAAKRLRLPVVATATDFWSICPTFQLVRWDESLCGGPNALACLACTSQDVAGTWPRRLAANRLLSAALAPVVTALGAVPVRRPAWLASLLWLSHRRRWMKKALSQVDVLVAPTSNTGRLLAETGLKPAEMRECGFGLEDHALQPLPARQRNGVLRLGYVGTFRHSKGVHVLLEAMRRLPSDKIQLAVYGSPGHFPEYDERLRELASGLDNVSFLGSFPNEKLPEVFAGFDALVIPSLWHENSPLVLLSAFAQKTPVVASRVGSLAEMVDDGKNGLLFTMGDAGSLAGQLKRLMAKPELIDRLRAGMPAVKTMDQNAAEMFAVYSRLESECETRRPAAARRPGYLPSGPLAWGRMVKAVRRIRFGAQFGDSLTLLRCTRRIDGNRQVVFDFEWHAADMDPDWTVFIHFLDESGATRVQGDHALCIYRQDPWGFVTYSFGIPIAEEHLGKTYQLRLGVWSPQKKERLPVTRCRSLEVEAANCAVLLGPLQMS